MRSDLTVNEAARAWTSSRANPSTEVGKGMVGNCNFDTLTLDPEEKGKMDNQTS